jgi:thioredoxin reductase (NADPH)
MHDLIIIGAGPAGLTAGIYAGRYRLKTLILEKFSVGGQIILSPTIENFPGFPGGVATEELIRRMREQVEELEVPIVIGEAQNISLDQKSVPPIFTVKTAEEAYTAKCVLIATGAHPKQLGVSAEGRLVGRGVSYCATCDGPLFKNKDVVAVGGGDRALEEALFLSTYAKTVTVVHLRQQLRGSKILEEKARGNEKIRFILDTVIRDIEGRERVEAVQLQNVQTKEVFSYSCQGVFIFVGIQPNTECVKNILPTDSAGFIITDQNMMTQQAGIFACGDCCRKHLYQVVTACGEAASCVHAAHNYLLNL